MQVRVSVFSGKPLAPRRGARQLPRSQWNIGRRGGGYDEIPVVFLFVIVAQSGQGISEEEMRELVKKRIRGVGRPAYILHTVIYIHTSIS